MAHSYSKGKVEKEPTASTVQVWAIRKQAKKVSQMARIDSNTHFVNNTYILKLFGLTEALDISGSLKFR